MSEQIETDDKPKRWQVVKRKTSPQIMVWLSDWLPAERQDYYFQTEHSLRAAVSTKKGWDRGRAPTFQEKIDAVRLIRESLRDTYSPESSRLAWIKRAKDIVYPALNLIRNENKS